MKLRLPIILLTALSVVTAQAAEYYHAKIVRVYDADKYGTVYDINTTYNEDFDNAAPKAWVKDGQGELTFKVGEPSEKPSYFAPTATTPMTTENVIIVREGTLTLDGTHIANYTKLDSYVSNLLVGGKNAHLNLDNGASYTQKISYANNSASAIAIGSGDGKGKVTLSNGSLLHTDHFVFAGYEKLTGGYVAQTLNVNNYPEDVYANGEHGRSEIYINSGSTLSAGTSLQFANVDVVVSGKDAEGNSSVLTDNTLGKSIDSVRTADPASYLGYNGETKITAEDGGRLEFNWNLSTGFVRDAEGTSSTTINVTGEGSSIAVAGEAAFGNGESWWDGEAGLTEEQKTAYGYTTTAATATSTTDVSLKEGAVGEFNQVKVGQRVNATMTVDEASRIIAHENATEALLEICAKGTVDNEGEIAIATKVSGGELTAYAGSTMAEVMAESGTLNIVGGDDSAVTMTGSLTLGDNITVAFSENGFIDLKGNALTIGENTVITVQLTEGQNADELTLFKNAALGSVTEVSVKFVDENGAVTGTGTAGVTTIPEPATATLSLLALAALAARRRRR